MTMPTSHCPWRMQVHHIHQETPDVWTLSLLCHDYYPYRAGQYALVSVRNSADTLRASSSAHYYQEFVDAAEAAIRNYRFYPARIGRCAVRQLVRFPFVFALLPRH